MCLVAEADGIQGYTLGAVTSKGDSGWVLNLVVRSFARKRGIGRLLAKKLIDAMVQLNLSKLVLTVEPENHPAIRLYEDLGFKSERFEPDYFSKGYDRMIMKMNL